MRTDKGKAFVMRREGKSYREIARELDVAKSTLSNWFKGVDFSSAIKEELTKKASKRNRQRFQELNRTRGIALEVQYDLAEKEALKELKLYRNLPLFTAALALYWANGDKTSVHQVRIMGSEAAQLGVFVSFLESVCGVDKSKIKLALFIHSDEDEQRCKRNWKKQLGIGTFYKTQVVAGNRTASPNRHGTCALVVSNAYLKKKLQTWIDHLPEMVLNTVPKRKK